MSPIDRQIAARAQVFARDVTAAMLALRGWPDSENAPQHVRDDVFHTCDRHSRLYTRCFTDGVSPAETARHVQCAEWDGGAR